MRTLSQFCMGICMGAQIFLIICNSNCQLNIQLVFLLSFKVNIEEMNLLTIRGQLHNFNTLTKMSYITDCTEISLDKL